MKLIKKVAVSIVAAVLLIIVGFLAVHGFEIRKYRIVHGNNPVEEQAKRAVDPDEEAQKIKPSSELAQFFSEVKSAERIIFIESTETPTDERDLHPVSVFDVTEPMYWKVMDAVVSASIGDPVNEQGGNKIYVMRWYKKYKKLAEAVINTRTGELEIRYPEKITGKEAFKNSLTKSETRPYSKKLYIKMPKLGVIAEAAEFYQKGQNLPEEKPPVREI
ncbi:MAG: hypothetical protein K6T91_03910 [Firmicutes bacterium]|nr:hypothetical protein [Bacillota bacterium]